MNLVQKAILLAGALLLAWMLLDPPTKGIPNPPSYWQDIVTDYPSLVRNCLAVIALTFAGLCVSSKS